MYLYRYIHLHLPLSLSLYMYLLIDEEMVGVEKEAGVMLKATAASLLSPPFHSPPLSLKPQLRDRF